MPRCFVIIPVYDLAAVTRQCLENVLGRPPATCEQEIIVVDDGSRDATPRVLDGFGDRIRVVAHPRNAGFAVACNDGATAATGDYLLFLNNDTVPLPGWLDALVRYAEDHPEAAAVGGKLLYPDGTVQHAGMAIDQAGVTPRRVLPRLPRAVGAARASGVGLCLLGVPSRSCLWVRETYRARSGIESSSRQMDQARGRTSPRRPELRVLYAGIAPMLGTEWVRLHVAVVSLPRRGGRWIRPERLRHRARLHWLIQVIEEAFGTIGET